LSSKDFQKNEISSLRTGGMAQVVECLLCKFKALRSNPRPIKKKKKISKIMLVILPIQEAEIRRMADQSQPRQIVHETLC
jgi:hypothetical protein